MPTNDWEDIPLSKDEGDWEDIPLQKMDRASELESAALGAAHGGTFGFADELGGAAQTAKQKLFGEIPSEEGIGGRYKSNRDRIRAYIEKSRQENPKSFTAGEVGGSVAGSFVPGLGIVGGAAKGAGLAARAGKAALTGAITGLGTSEADLTKGQLEEAGSDTLKGAALGGGIESGFFGAGKALKHVTPTNAAKKLSKTFLGAPEKALDTYMENPEAVKKALPRKELSDQLTEYLNKFRDENVIGGSQSSRNLLEFEGQKIPKSEIADMYKQKADELIARSEGVVDDQTQATLDFLKKKESQFKGSGPDDTVSLNRMKDEVQSLQRMTDYGKRPGEISSIDNRVTQYLGKKLNQDLKGRSPAYEQLMQQVSKDAKLLDETTEIAKSDKGIYNMLDRVAKDRDPFAREKLGAFDKRIAEDATDAPSFLKQADLAYAKEAFDKGSTQGSRNVQLFKTMGEEIGKKLNIPFSPAIGAAAGAVVDKYGPQIAMKSVDMAVGINQFWKQNPNIDAFRQLMKPAVEFLRKGNPSSVLTMQILSESNPDLLNMLEKELGQQRNID